MFPMANHGTSPTFAITSVEFIFYLEFVCECLHSNMKDLAISIYVITSNVNCSFVLYISIYSDSASVSCIFNTLIFCTYAIVLVALIIINIELILVSACTKYTIN